MGFGLKLLLGFRAQGLRLLGFKCRKGKNVFEASVLRSGLDSEFQAVMRGFGLQASLRVQGAGFGWFGFQISNFRALSSVGFRC